MDARDIDWTLSLADAIESAGTTGDTVSLDARYVAGSLRSWATRCESLRDLAQRCLTFAQAPLTTGQQRIGYLAVADMAHERSR